MKDEKLEIKKKPQEIKKEDLDKVAGGGCGGPIKPTGCGLSHYC